MKGASGLALLVLSILALSCKAFFVKTHIPAALSTGRLSLTRSRNFEGLMMSSTDPLVKSAGAEGSSTQQGGLGRKVAIASAIAATCALTAAAPSLASTGTTMVQGMSESGFVQSFLLIFVSEIGDKTFFIAGLLAAKYGRLVSFTGSVGALAVMTVISTVLGQIFHAVPSSLTQGIPFDDYVAVAAFSYFGIKTLLDASKLEEGDSSGIAEEKAEAEEIVDELNPEKLNSTVSLLIQTFSLVFAAEIGDRSFLSTIALSAALNPFAVAGGAIAAHASATGVAVIGGALMSKYLSEKVIGYIGGSLFIVFAITTALGIF